MKKLIQALPILVALFTVGAMVACKDKGPHLNPEIKFEATIDGLQQIPRTSSTATGRLDGLYNKDTRKLTYTITYS
ncbi:MAG: CHRD domain-containing protein, partial [Runella slithyformis]